MERLNITLAKTERLQPYSCMEIVPKSEGCTFSEFSPNGEYLLIGCQNGSILVYSFYTHNIVWRHRPLKPGKVLKLRYTESLVHVLTDANQFYSLQIQGDELNHAAIHFKVTSMDVKPPHAVIFGRCDVVLHHIPTADNYSIKQDALATEWFGCFSQTQIVLFASPNNIFYIVDYSGQLLHKQDVGHIFQAAVREVTCNTQTLFLVSARDRALRVFELKKPFEFIQTKEIFECIEKKRWAASCFFTIPNMESWFVLGCPYENGSHSLQMFDTFEIESNVSLAKNMHSPLGAASQLCTSRNTHVYPVVSLVTQAGSVVIWSSGNLFRTYKWSTSLGIPNFVQLQNGNIEYDEPEDQFDKDESGAKELEFRDVVKDEFVFRINIGN